MLKAAYEAVSGVRYTKCVEIEYVDNLKDYGNNGFTLKVFNGNKEEWSKELKYNNNDNNGRGNFGNKPQQINIYVRNDEQADATVYIRLFQNKQLIGELELNDFVKQMNKQFKVMRFTQIGEDVNVEITPKQAPRVSVFTCLC